VRRFAIIALACVAVPAAGWVAASAGPVAALAAGPAAARAPRAQLTGFLCVRARNALSREIAITAVMRPLPGTLRMALRFQLERRVDGGRRYQRVPGHDLDRWLRPDPPSLGREPGDVWRLAKPVVDLPAPASYRLRVAFRWQLAGRREERVLYSPTCDER